MNNFFLLLFLNVDYVLFSFNSLLLFFSVPLYHQVSIIVVVEMLKSVMFGVFGFTILTQTKINNKKKCLGLWCCCHCCPNHDCIPGEFLYRQICWPLMRVHTLSHRGWHEPSTRFMLDPNTQQETDVTQRPCTEKVNYRKKRQHMLVFSRRFNMFLSVNLKFIVHFHLINWYDRNKLSFCIFLKIKIKSTVFGSIWMQLTISEFSNVFFWTHF